MRESNQGLYQHDEEGVQGIAIDPNFDSNRWVYVGQLSSSSSHLPTAGGS